MIFLKKRVILAVSLLSVPSVIAVSKEFISCIACHATLASFTLWYFFHDAAKVCTNLTASMYCDFTIY